MKKNFLKIFTTITVAAILAVGVSYVSAQSTNPQPSQPAPMVNAPIHTGIITQGKMGDVLSQKVLAAPIGLFKKSIFLPGKNAALRIGSSDTATGTQSFNTGTAGATATQLNTMIFNGTHTEPVVLDLVKRSSGPAIRYINTGGQCTVATRLVNDRSSAFQFNKGSSSANIIARQVQLTAGNPAKDRVLVGDASGNARWATATVSNGQVVFSTNTTSPVPDGQCIAPDPAPVDVCPNIAGAQSTLPFGMLIVPSYDKQVSTGTTYMTGVPGDCESYCIATLVPDITYPFACQYDSQNTWDICPNINGTQTTVPAGMVRNSNRDCVAAAADLCPNINGNQTSIPSNMIVNTSGNCVQVSQCTNIYDIESKLPIEYPTTPSSGIPVGFTLQGNNTCQPMKYWHYDKVASPGGTANVWRSWNMGALRPQVIPYVDSEQYHQPYCTAINYRPGDKYYSSRTICTDYSVTPDNTAYSPTATPQLQGCSNYPDLYKKTCN